MTTTAAADPPRLTVTVSAPHLVAFPMLEATVEARVSPRTGVALIGGRGGLHPTDELAALRLTEVGASVRRYLTGDFATGLQIGAEALYLHATATGPGDVAVFGAGLSVGPFVGYKWTHRIGLSLEAQLGVAVVAVAAEADHGVTGDTAKVGPILNLGAGWSF